jgi:hypothetical protein
MPITSFDATDRTYARLLQGGAWSLCVGAGICRGIAPDWAEIARAMLARATLARITALDVGNIVQTLGWSLDSVLQLALNEYLLRGATSQAFYSDLAEELWDRSG